MRTIHLARAACLALLFAANSHAASLNLFAPVQLAPGTWLLAPTIPGEAQVGVVVGERSVAVIGAPKSGVYARQIVEHVGALTDKPISHVIVLSQFCDHACGSAALSESATIVASDRLDPARPRTWVSRLQEGPEYYADAGIATAELVVTSSVAIDLGGRTVIVRKAESADDAAGLVAQQEDVKIAWAGSLFTTASAAIAPEVLGALPGYRIVPGNDVSASGSRFVPDKD